MPKEQQYVYVISHEGNPLMPTNPAKARKMIKSGKADVVTLQPFTIRLKYVPSTNEVQPCVLGIDTGSKTIGAAVTIKGNGMNKVVYAGEAKIRQDIPDKMKQRATLRRGRRNRNTRYRPARWSNRANSKRRGRLVPTAMAKLSCHQRYIENICKILPISELALELASFDTQKMQNPEIKGVEYQRGELAGYELREYLYDKWKRKCAYCGKENVPFELEHIIPKARGGSNRVTNLAIACHECNQKKGTKTAKEFGHPEVEKYVRTTLKDAAHVGQIKWALWNWAKDYWWTGKTDKIRYEFGFRTKFKRKEIGWDKGHAIDAAAISLELEETAIPVMTVPSANNYQVMFKVRNSRQLHDSKPNKVDRSKYPVHYRRPTDTTRGKNTTKDGRVFRRGDVISYNGKAGILSGTSASGNCRYTFFDGTKDRKTINKAKRVMRATNITHWPVQTKEDVVDKGK